MLAASWPSPPGVATAEVQPSCAIQSRRRTLLRSLRCKRQHRHCGPALHFLAQPPAALSASRALRKDVILTARQHVALMGSAMPPCEVLVEERLRCAQEESVRTLVKRASATLPLTLTIAEAVDTREGALSAAAGDTLGPVPSVERLKLLEEMYASNLRALSGGQVPSVAATDAV